MPCYFFSGKEYIKVLRSDEEPGSVLLGYPESISVWNWGDFGKNGIDAALYSGSKDYFFAGKEYIRVTRGADGAGTKDPGYPKPISDWGWGAFGANGIDAALYSGSKTYFFSDLEYIRVTRDDSGAGTMDAGYPKPITDWGWGTFGLFGIQAAMNSGDVDYFFDRTEYIRVRRDDTGKGKIDPGYPLPIWHWGWGEFGAQGIDAALFSGTDTVEGPVVETPETGLGSNSNYYFYETCQTLEGVTITINITEDVVVKSSSGAVKGFGFQLNCYSPIGEKSAWQQYVISMHGDELIAVVNNYPMTGTYLILDSVHLHTFPSAKLPAGYQLKIQVQTDAHQNVVGAIYTVISNEGERLAQKVITLIEIEGVTKADLAPIVAFQLNMVGPSDKEKSVLSSGAGHFIYESDSYLLVQSSKPFCAESDYTTAERANTVYGKLNLGPSAAFTQTFNITSESAMIRVTEKVGPGLKVLYPPRH
jgi:Hemopexin